MTAHSTDKSTAPREIEGIKCFAPELMYAEADYPAGAFAKLIALEANNFWFRSRNRIIARTFRKFVLGSDRSRVLEIGCGTGFVLSALRVQRRFDLVGAEQHLAGLKFAKERLPDVEFVQLDARDLPYRAEFHAVGAFDVLEHIEEDEQVLASVHEALMPNGLIVLTVPQHAWLWSPADDHARHKRRYSRAELVSKLQRHGFTLRFCTSFVFTLLPLMYLSRLRARTNCQDEAAESVYGELALPLGVDRALGAVMRIDEALIAAGISLPIGGSLLAVAQRTS